MSANADTGKDKRSRRPRQLTHQQCIILQHTATYFHVTHTYAYDLHTLTRDIETFTYDCQ